MQNVTARAWPDRTLLPFCWADRRVLEQPCFRCMGAVGKLLSGCLSFSGKHLPGPPTPISHPVYLSIRRRLLSDYWTLASPAACVHTGAPMEDGGLGSKDHSLVPCPSPLPCARHWARRGVSSANMNPGGIRAPASWLPSQGPAGLTLQVHSPPRLPSLSPGGSELPPLLPGCGDPDWEKETNIHQTCPCLLLLCRNCNNLAE